MTRLALSARVYHRLLRLARTIADLDGESDVGPQHICEAITLRSLDRG
jgi:magnesium chelatase family protein